jgi:flagellar basal-body rod protein FlgG
MLAGLFSSASALDAFQTSLETTSNNLANINTTAFKRSTVSFQDLMPQGSLNQQVGQGVRVSAISQGDMQQGPIQKTGNDLDLSILGNGFFAVQTPSGQIQYSRDGSFRTDALNRLVDGSGNILQPPMTLPADTISTTISAQGVVSVVTSSAPTSVTVLGHITLAGFSNPAGLQVNAGNLYSETPASGPPTIAAAGSNGLGTIQQGALEQSNVDMTSEMASLVTAQQAFNVNSQAVKTADQIVSSSLNLVQ